jgi:hypothetical protein
MGRIVEEIGTSSPDITDSENGNHRFPDTDEDMPR